ncbi:hypothetical protein J7L29_01400 [Candidatus Bathyarchaeota archaeon]|nr:hypothetical protein [Candidatus Bathyarchaeota archaeon]
MYEDNLPFGDDLINLTSTETLGLDYNPTEVGTDIYSRIPAFYGESKNISLSIIPEEIENPETVIDTTTKNLGVYKEYFSSKSNREITAFLSERISEHILNFILKEKIVDPKELCSVISWLEDKYVERYGNLTVSIFFDPEEGFQFLEFCFPKGNWEEWKNLSREIKEEMINADMQDIASKVAIVCLEALQEQQS